MIKLVVKIIKGLDKFLYDCMDIFLVLIFSWLISQIESVTVSIAPVIIHYYLIFLILRRFVRLLWFVMEKRIIKEEKAIVTQN